MKRIYFFATAILFLVFTMGSCKKDSSATDPIVASSEDNAEVSAMYDDIDNEANSISNLKSTVVEPDTTVSTGKKLVVVTELGDTLVRKITFTDYVNGRNTRIKNGTIIIKTVKSDTRFIPNYRNITFENFAINGIKIEGNRTIVYDSITKTFNITLVGGKATFSDNTTYTRTTENRTKVWNNNGTPSIWDDTYTITGSATGINRKNEAYTHTITMATALVMSVDCRWIKSGVIEATIGIKKASIDYGSGSCDNIAMVTIEGKQHEIKLKGGK